MTATDSSTLVGLVSHYSPSGQEGGAVKWLVTRMQSLGYDEAFVDGAGNAIGRVGKGPKQVILLGHVDTVPGEIPVTLTSDPRPSSSETGDVLKGRGSVDAKGPLASFADAVADVGAVDGWQFVVIGAVEEERDSKGALFVVDKYKPDFAIIGEPNRWDRIALGYKGSAWASVTITREQAHSASREQTAAETAVEAWLKARTYVDSFNADKEKAFDKLLLSLRRMDSGCSDFEQWARLEIDVRLPVGISPSEWYATLGEILQGARIEPLGFAVSAWQCEKNTPLVRAFLSAIRSQGGEPQFVYKTGTADLNIVAPVWKCPALAYGPGDSNLDHTPNEHISLEEYAKAVRVLSGALEALAKPQRQV